MKKIILGILFLFTVSIAFAMNDVSDDSKKSNDIQIVYSISNPDVYLDKVDGICRITINAYNQDGELVESRTLYFQSESSYHCAQLTAAFREFLAAQ